jgi:hypothetical protein
MNAFPSWTPLHERHGNPGRRNLSSADKLDASPFLCAVPPVGIGLGIPIA